jgi:hypothetical protein
MTDREFWEKCGYYQHKERYFHRDLPDINSLDDLVKYGLPVVIKKVGALRAYFMLCDVMRLLVYEREKPATALFEALCKALEVEG